MFAAPKPISDDCKPCGFALPNPARDTETRYGCVLRIAIGTTTFTIEFVLAGDTSPKLIVTTRLFKTLALPVTEPPSAPVMVGWPPLLMSKVCAEIVFTAQTMSMQTKIPEMTKRRFIYYGAVTVKVTATVVLPSS